MQAEEEPEADSPRKDDEGLGHDELKRRARLGVVWLLVRTVALQFAVLGGTVVLARELTPGDFGVFAIAQYAMSFFLFFGDAGLGGALIQKEQEPSQVELSSVFVLQAIFAIAILLIIGFGAGYARLLWSDLPHGSEWVFRALSVGLVLTVVRVIPQILMERELLFGRLAAIDVASTIGFYGGAVAGAYAGLGVWALVIGALLQGVLSTGLALALRPWLPSMVLDRAALEPILRFGIPFQAKNLIGFLNSAVSPVYAGAALGATKLGFIQWAQTTAYFPLKLVSIMGRVTFPLFSRLAKDPKAFAETLGRTLMICAFGTFFFVGLFGSMGRNVIHIVFTDKWMPALPLLYVYVGAISIGFIAPVIASALDAAGKPQIFAKLSLGWTALNWIVVVITTPRWGMFGFAAGYCVHVVVGNIVVLIVMLYIIPGVRPARRVASSIVACGAVFAFGRWISPHAMTVPTFVGAIIACVAIYLLVLAVLDLQGIKDAIAMVPNKSKNEEPAAA